MQKNKLQKQSIRHKALRPRILRLVLAASLSTITLNIGLARAAEPVQQGQSQALNIPAQPLSSALTALSKQTGIQIYADGALVAGRNAPAINGKLSAKQALNRLLEGSGLNAVPEAGNNFTIQKQTIESSQLPEVAVKALVEALPGDLPKSFAGGQVAAGSRVGMLGNTNIFDTPFSTKSYTSEFIRNQNARSIDDVIANDPSIRVSYSPTFVLDQTSIRGFSVPSNNYLFDGVQGLFSYGRIPVQNLARVEVFKGPSAGLIGSLGAVGGTINVVPKRATDAPIRSVTLAAYDKSLLTAQVDIGQRFGPDNVFGARFNIYTENGEQYNGSKRELLAPQLALDYHGDGVRVMLDAGYTRYKTTGYGALWTLQAGAPVPRVPDPRTNPLASWNSYEVEQTFGLLTAELDFSKAWTGYARYGQYLEKPVRNTGLDYSPLDGNGQYVTSGSFTFPWRQSNNTIELGLRGTFETGWVTHQLALSALRSRKVFDSGFTSVSSATTTGNIYATSQLPDPFAAGLPKINWVPGEPNIQTSFALADTMSMLQDRFKLTLAARLVSIEAGVYEQSRVSPTAAAVYKLAGGFSLYSNYAEALTQGEIAAPPASNTGAQLPPYVSKQNEFGMKWNRGSYGVTAAYFDISQAFAFIDTNRVFRAGGEQRNKGIELETFGEPIAGWRLLGGVAWIDGKQTKTDSSATDGKKALGVPEFTANLGMEHDLSAIPGMTLTTRLVHTGSAYVDLLNTQELDAWNRIDIGARYATRLSGRDFRFNLGINNLLDKAYWQTAGSSIISVAQPRTFQLSASMGF